MRATLWFVFHYLRSGRRFFDLPTWLSIAGMAIGVASLVVTMAVVSGYQSTLETGIQDSFGHMLIMKRGEGDAGKILSEVKAVVPDLKASTPFLDVESIIAHKGKVNGVLLEGVDPSTVDHVLNLKDHLIAGHWDFGSGMEDVPAVMIGKDIASRFHLKVDDVFSLVIPLTDSYDRSSFHSKIKKFRVEGILNFGRHDFDSRMLLTNIKAAQDFLGFQNQVTGIRVTLNDPNQTWKANLAITQRYGYVYHIRDWVDVNRNLFEAIKIEKNVIFAVLLILIIAASFNISSTLFVSVMRRFPDISVLRTMGANNRLIRWLFTGQGLAVGTIGITLGVILGLLLCRAFDWAQVHLGILPAQVYKLEHVNLQVRLEDLSLIIGSSLLICFLATLLPSRMGSRLQVVEGLRYE